jgi:probable LLM family oxidoreductase
MELGIYTFVENAAGIAPAQRMRNLMEEMTLADETGLDVFGIGEHHRPDYLVSSPAVVLAAGAQTTRRIRLTSAVSVLSSDDPIRIFQDFATLDLISNGRAEIMAGRGSFIESFPLFGYDLDDYDALFAEKLEMLLAIRDSVSLDWPGSEHTHRVPGRGVYPRPVQNPLPVWIAVGGTAQSVVRAGTLGIPLALAIIGGQWAQFEPFVDLFRQAAARAGHDAEKLPVSINSHGFIADTGKEAADVAFPAFNEVMNRIGKERGWPPSGRDQFEASRLSPGAIFVGDPQQVIDKILKQHELFRHDRFLMQMSIGAIPHERLMRSIELFGTVVAPAVRKALG